MLRARVASRWPQTNSLSVYKIIVSRGLEHLSIYPIHATQWGVVAATGLACFSREEPHSALWFALDLEGYSPTVRNSARYQMLPTVCLFTCFEFVYLL
jgi:hypothetical protein